GRERGPGGGGLPPRALRPDPDGPANARAGRPGGNHSDPPTGTIPGHSHPHHRANGPRREGGPAALPRGRPGRVPDQPAEPAGPAPSPRAPSPSGGHGPGGSPSRDRD